MIKKIFLLLIRLYQSLPFGSVCKHFPSCSQYTYEAIKKYGIIFGVCKGIKRITRCNNFFEGGFDPLI